MPEKKKVLVICRSAVGRMYLGVLLNRIWYAPVFAENASEGTQIGKKHTFSVLVMDMDMPDQERSAAVSVLKSDLLMKSLPLIGILATENSALCESLISQGCSAIIQKPINFSMFYAILCRLSGEPRQTTRVPVRMRVEIEEQIPDKFLHSVNISEGGIYLRTHAPLPETTLLHLSFTLPSDTGKIKVMGEVVRKTPLEVQFDTEPGIGLRFIGISEDTRNRIRNFVKWTLMGDLEWESDVQSP
ncbi:MAG TPA: PilZ domain-containing protein [Nitrospirota bacterium]|nr:PilZ domain-containing protein [Nitrospirota bacterium]